MKALLYKDLLLLWKEGRGTALFFAAMAAASYLLQKGELAPINGFGLLFLLLIVPLDLDSHWLNTLPISSKARVWSKYIEFWGLSLAHFLLVWAVSILSPSDAVTREVLVTFLVYWAIALGILSFFLPVLSMFGTQNKWAFSFFFLTCFLGYFAGLIPLGLVRESPLTVPDVLPYVGILWVTSVISAFLAADQYRKAWAS
ncbi:MAG: ABC-2 transporter permease [Ruminiclostridium sp.]|nr:ABC-2 transporter permease [Ruminiclostridium sp.]